MLYTDSIKKASDIMMRAHAGQVDKGGYHYVMHPIHLAEQLAFEDEIIVALLHDVMEDHPEFSNEIIEAGFSQKIIDALTILNRNSTINSGKTYWEYIQNVATNRLATLVKLVDLAHNMDTSRIGIGDKKVKRSNRYKRAYQYLYNTGTNLILEEEEVTDEQRLQTEIHSRSSRELKSAYRIVLDSPKYSGEICLQLESVIDKLPSIIRCSGKVKSKTYGYPERACNNSGYMSGTTKNRLEAVGKSIVKEHLMIFKNVAFNRDIKIGITMNFKTGIIEGVKLYECINTLRKIED